MIALRAAHYVAVPWRNGAGVTREIHREPAGAAARSGGTAADAARAAEFDWRLSLATIDSAGPFSAFPGYERTLVLVSGAGVELSFGHATARLDRVGQTVCFDGGWATSCRLLGGPSTDLNLIVCRASWQAATRCLQGATSELIQTAGCVETLVCCISGNLQLTSRRGARQQLAAVDVARCFPSDGTIDCTLAEPAAVAFIAHLRRVGAG